MAATEQQHAWVLRVLGFEAPTASASDEGVEDAVSDSERVADFSVRLKIVDKDIRALGLSEEFAAPLRKAAEATKARSPDASALLDVLERQIAEATGRRRMQSVMETVKKASVSAKTGVVALGKARIQLAMARSTYQSVRETLVAACEQTRLSMVGDGIAEDPETIAAVAKIGEKVPDIEAMSGDVQDALDDMINTADPDARNQARQKAISAIGAYRQSIDGQPILVRMQSTPAGNFAIRDALVGALDTLEQALAA